MIGYQGLKNQFNAQYVNHQHIINKKRSVKSERKKQRNQINAYQVCLHR